MCVDPVTAMVIAGGVTGAAGSLQSASAQSAALKAQAAQANAQSQQVSNKNTFDIDAANRDFDKQQGKSRNIIGNSGINPASFSSVLDDDATQHALELAAIRQGSDANKASLKSAASNALSQAKSTQVAGYINAFGSIVGAGTSLAKINAKQQMSGIGDFDTEVYPAGVQFGGTFSS